MVAASESVRASSQPPIVEATLDVISFLPSTPSELRVGDEIQSISGTKRSVLLIAHSSTSEAVFQFSTTRANGGETTENVSTRNLSLANAREVQRKLLAKLLELSAHSHNLRNLKLGDILVLESGERYLITGQTGIGSDARYFCLVKSVQGALNYGQLTENEISNLRTTSILRWEHPQGTTPLATGDSRSSSYIPFSMMFNLESLLGRGELGDRFVIAMSNASMVMDGLPGEFSLSASVNERSRQISRFSSEIERQPKTPQLLLRMRDTGEGPLGISGFTAHHLSDPALIDEFRHAVLLANTLKGLFDTSAVKSR